MTYYGKVKDGVVVLEGPPPPDGTPVQIIPSEQALPPLPELDIPENATLGERMRALAEWAEKQPCTLPADLAKNHDHYLHGLPKRK